MREKTKNTPFYLYGRHSCTSALTNKNRICYELIVSQNYLNKSHDIIGLAKSRNINYKVISEECFNKNFSHCANQQGISLKVDPIIGRNPEKIISEISKKDNSSILILDQITNVNNIGSIIRSAACFDVDLILLTQNNSSSENYAMSKTSSGAIDSITVMYITNLVNTVKYLQTLGYWSYGLEVKAQNLLPEIKFHNKSLLILGSEDKGLRQLTKKNCDFLVSIPMSTRINSLNVSNAAAISLYFMFINKNK